MRHIKSDEVLTVPVTDEERESYANYQATTLSDTSLITYVIRRRNLLGWTI